MLKNATGFYMSYNKKILVCISDSALQLLLPPKSRKMPHHRHIMCGCRIYIQDRIYQWSLNHWSKRRLLYTKNNSNTLIGGSVEQLNTRNIFSRYSDLVLPDGEPIHPRSKDTAFGSMCEFTNK